MIGYEQLWRRKRKTAPPAILLCLDPGHRTGWAVFVNGALKECGEIQTVIEDSTYFAELVKLFDSTLPTQVCFEDYRIYDHKLDRHARSNVKTLRVIGGIELLCYLRELPTTSRMASAAKTFVTDKKLKDWGLWADGQKHARDAIRHGVYEIVFGG